MFDNYEQAYDEAVRLWEDMFNTPIIQEKMTQRVINKILKNLFDLNKKEERNKTIAQEVIDAFPRDIKSILAIMKTEEARTYISNWN
jgi:hypothetical protein